MKLIDYILYTLFLHHDLFYPYLEYFPTFELLSKHLRLKALRLGVCKHRTVYECSIQLSGAISRAACCWFAPMFLWLFWGLQRRNIM